MLLKVNGSECCTTMPLSREVEATLWSAARRIVVAVDWPNEAATEEETTRCGWPGGERCGLTLHPHPHSIRTLEILVI